MGFKVEKAFFDLFPSACFGVVVAKCIDNQKDKQEISDFFLQEMEKRRQYFVTNKVKEEPAIKIWRDSFKKLGYNPNKFSSSIEAMSSRVAKGGKIPLINNIVNLTNGLSLKYLLPMGAHDLDCLEGDIQLCFNDGNYSFTPFGQEEQEEVEKGELVYRDDLEVRTRKWTWRQGNKAKITTESKNIFFPIDGFSDFNLEQVLTARDQLAKMLEQYFAAEVQCYFLDKNNLETSFK